MTDDEKQNSAAWESKSDGSWIRGATGLARSVAKVPRVASTCMALPPTFTIALQFSGSIRKSSRTNYGLKAARTKGRINETFLSSEFGQLPSDCGISSFPGCPSATPSINQ